MAARLDTACPRYYGAACEHTGFAHIEVAWTGPAALRVTMDSPALDWTLTAVAPPVLRALNAVSRALPDSTWRPRPLVRAREKLASALGMGDLTLSGVMPSGHVGTLMPQQMFFIDDAHATLDGVDLGRPVRLAETPTIGEVPLPARGVLAIGRAVWSIRDQPEFDRVRAQVAQGVRDVEDRGTDGEQDAGT